MRHEMLTQRTFFCHHKKGTLCQHFVMHVVAPLVWVRELGRGLGEGVRQGVGRGS